MSKLTATKMRQATLFQKAKKIENLGQEHSKFYVIEMIQTQKDIKKNTTAQSRIPLEIKIPYIDTKYKYGNLNS
jgi:hypothetical protein